MSDLYNITCNNCKATWQAFESSDGLLYATCSCGNDRCEVDLIGNVNVEDED